MTKNRQTLCYMGVYFFPSPGSKHYICDGLPPHGSLGLLP